MPAVTGLVFAIQRFSIHDGPGIRTVVFLKGCPLRCRWCHNPEGLAARSEVLYDADRCRGCGACQAACPQGVHGVDPGGAHHLDRSRCQACGACVRVCAAGALELSGRQMTVAQVLAEVERDRPFYEESGGGLTLSGGEPFAQAAFASALLGAAKAVGLHTVVETSGACFQSGRGACPQLVETSGACPQSGRGACPQLVDLFLFDIKAVDCGRHVALTGLGNAGILANLRGLLAGGAAVCVRFPLVGGCNDSEDDLAQACGLIAALPGCPQVAVLPYHPLGGGKYRRLGRPEPTLNGTVPAATLRRWQEALTAAARR